MNTYLDNAKQELMRTDHLLYVSLKYTRTVDILKSILKKLIAVFDNCIMALLKLKVEQGKIKDVPSNVMSRIETIEKFYPHPEFKQLLNFYLVMRKLDKGEPIRSNEYRRGVRMSVALKGIIVEVDIDSIEEYFKWTETFLRITSKILDSAEEGGEENLEEITHGVRIDLKFERG